MENAVKALLIAAGVIIGVMILTLGVSLFTSLSQFTESIQENITSKEVQQFNEQFVKYINCSKTTDEANFKLTIQDIVTAANTAYENNQHYGLTDYENNNYYVIIKLDGTELEKNINTNTQLTQILQNGLGQEYKCSYNDVKFDTITGRVYEVNFHKATP